VILLYALTLISSWSVQRIQGWRATPDPDPSSSDYELVHTGPGEPAQGTLTPLRVRRWAPLGDTTHPIPVLLLHGSPGDGANFNRLGAALAAKGFHVVAPDLPGFGESPVGEGDVSMRSHARTMLSLGAVGTRRAPKWHVVGWSNGGGVALHMTDMAPERLASLTLLASIGTQEDEGSGSYAFEHFKYALGFAVVGGVPELVPHFGLLGSFRTRTAWLRNFWESDQRPLEAIMRRTTTPILILHGRTDPLVPLRTAEHSHRLIATSSLVITPYSHFLPFMQPEETASLLAEHFALHDAPGVAARTDRRDLTPPHTTDRLDGLFASIERAITATPWWIEVLAIALLVSITPGCAVMLVGLLIVDGTLDPVVTLLGIAAGFAIPQVVAAIRGRATGTPDPDWLRRLSRAPFAEGFGTQFVGATRRRGAARAGAARAGAARTLRFALGRALGIGVWSLVSLVCVVIAESLLVGKVRVQFGLFGVVYTLIKLVLIADLAPMIVTRRGRQHLRAMFDRLIHHEYWPTWAYYLPLFPFQLFLAFRHGGATLFTCCNPGIEHGGGFSGESKSRIMAALPIDPRVLPTQRIDTEAPQHRVAFLHAIMERDPRFAFPLILKPDAGERGHAVRLVRSHDDALRYFQEMTAPAVAQPYHPGPHECGVMWIRRSPGDAPTAQAPDAAGFIYSVTRKDFPEIVGDGRRTLEDLILAHPRYRRQASVFLERFETDASRVLDAGEPLRLGVAGNHAQGTLFRDGADLITPHLAREIDRLASAFVGGLDFGRFDIRYTSDDSLRKGEDFAILELNGVTSESTNLYDPSRSVFWAFGVLFGQWRHLYQLGAWRHEQGIRPLGFRGLWKAWRGHARNKRGPAIAS